MKTETEITLNLICVLLAFAIGFIVLRISPPSPFPLKMLCVVCSVWAYQTLIRLPKMPAKPGNCVVRNSNLLGSRVWSLESRVSGFHGAAGVLPASPCTPCLPMLMCTLIKLLLCNKESCKQWRYPYPFPRNASPQAFHMKMRR